MFTDRIMFSNSIFPSLLELADTFLSKSESVLQSFGGAVLEISFQTTNNDFYKQVFYTGL